VARQDYRIFVHIAAVLDKRPDALRTRADGCVQKISIFQFICHRYISCLQEELNGTIMTSLQGSINWYFPYFIQAMVIGVPGNIWIDAAIEKQLTKIKPANCWQQCSDTCSKRSSTLAFHSSCTNVVARSAKLSQGIPKQAAWMTYPYTSPCTFTSASADRGTWHICLPPFRAPLHSTYIHIHLFGFCVATTTQ
jgi:hypothetical protein